MIWSFIIKSLLKSGDKMKKIYYILTLLIILLTFTACDVSVLTNQKKVAVEQPKIVTKNTKENKQNQIKNTQSDKIKSSTHNKDYVLEINKNNKDLGEESSISSKSESKKEISKQNSPVKEKESDKDKVAKGKKEQEELSNSDKPLNENKKFDANPISKDVENINPKEEKAEPIINADKEDKTKQTVTQQSIALQKLDDLYNQGKLSSTLIQLEKSFSQNNYRGDIGQEKLYNVKSGKGKVMISTPHSTSHIREGNVKVVDIYTGSIGLLLQDLTGTHLIYTTKQGEDANYIEDGQYKEYLKQYIDDNNIELVLDLHGMSSSKETDIDLGTVNGKSISQSKVDIISSLFSDSGVKNVSVNRYFTANYKGTVTHYTYSHTKAESIQIEINRSHRNPRENEEKVYLLLKSLITIIESNS